jgi:hypothetical protein
VAFPPVSRRETPCACRCQGRHQRRRFECSSAAGSTIAGRCSSARCKRTCSSSISRSFAPSDCQRKAFSLSSRRATPDDMSCRVSCPLSPLSSWPSLPLFRLKPDVPAVPMAKPAQGSPFATLSHRRQADAERCCCFGRLGATSPVAVSGQFTGYTRCQLSRPAKARRPVMLSLVAVAARA